MYCRGEWCARLFDRQERERIEKAGGFVEDGRVNAMLEVSRAFGDVHLKSKGVICTPETVFVRPRMLPCRRRAG